MTKPASDELINEMQGFVDHGKPLIMLSMADATALIARIRQPEQCGKPDTSCEALRDARRIADHDKQLWLAAEARATAAEAKLADMVKEIERLKVALGEYVCDCKGQCQAEIYGGSCGRMAYAALKGGEG